MLRAENLGKSYKGRKIVKDFSIEMHQSKIIGLLGQNGAGKTTAFYMIVGLIKPDHGKILLANHDITQLPMYMRARLGLGYLPQESSIFKGLTVAQNIMCILEFVEKDSNVRQDKLEGLLKEFSIEHLRDIKAIALSGGEKRRVEIARCLATNPKYIFLDEPFAGIDPISISDIKSLIIHLKNKGIGVLITDHNVRETLNMIDSVYVMHDGIVLASGTSAQILKNTDVHKLYLGEKFNVNNEA